MSLKNFFGFNFQTLKQFLSADLKIDEKKIEIFLGKVDEGKNDFVLERDLLFAPVVEPRLAGC